MKNSNYFTLVHSSLGPSLIDLTFDCFNYCLHFLVVWPNDENMDEDVADSLLTNWRKFISLVYWNDRNKMKFSRGSHKLVDLDMMIYLQHYLINTRYLKTQNASTRFVWEFGLYNVKCKLYIIILYHCICICSPSIFLRYFQFYISIYHYLSCA